jgi:hypothetical protein
LFRNNFFVEKLKFSLFLYTNLNHAIMKRTIFILFAAALLLSFTQAEKKSKGFVKLFNGKNLDGWVIHGTEKWYVEKNLLICESGPDKKYGYLSTVKDYYNFELEVEFMQAANGNSGVFFRSTFEGTKVSGWQVEVAPPNHDTGGIYESYGRGWLVQIPDEKENILQMGKWNKMRIKAVDGRIITWLNGIQMVDLTDDKIAGGRGAIALQIHDGGGIKVYWKNLRIREL